MNCFISRAQLARETGLTEKTIWKLENGGAVRADTLAKISRAVAGSPEYLPRIGWRLSDENPQPREPNPGEPLPRLTDCVKRYTKGYWICPRCRNTYKDGVPYCVNDGQPRPQRTAEDRAREREPGYGAGRAAEDG